MINRIYDYMIDNKMIAQGSRVLAAVSGGADSMCLLAALRELQTRMDLQLRVFHVHHGLRESADRDLSHVSKYCQSAGIPFEAAYVRVGEYAAERHLSVEEAARHLRYQALEEAARRWDGEVLEEAAQGHTNENVTGSSESEVRPVSDKCRIAVAHHIEDQAETVLFNLARGSKLAGLRGMLPVNGRIIRPLLKCSRAEIEAFLADRGVSWQKDETNEDTAYTRNLLRREVMPLLAQINMRATEHIAKAAEEAAETEEFLKKETERALSACCTEQAPAKAGRDSGEEQTASGDRKAFYMISIPALVQEPPLIGRRVIYAVIAKAAGRKKDLQDVHVRDVLQLAGKKGNGRLDVFGGVKVEKVYEKLIFSADKRTERASASGHSHTAAAAAAASSRAAESIAALDRRWPVETAEYSCRVFDFDGDLSAVSRNLYTKWFDYDKIGAFPSFRNRRSGDRITLDDSGRSKALRRYMIDAKIPAELRDKIVLPALGSEILWIPAGKADESLTGKSAGMAAAKAVTDPPASKTEISCPADSGRISAAYMVSNRTRRILEIRWQPAR